MFLDINGWELVIIVVVALLVIGPERLPHYLARARETIRDLRRLAEGAKTQLRDQMGPEFDNVDWSAYDPRQYDPRRIVRDALAEGWDTTDEPGGADGATSGPGGDTGGVTPPRSGASGVAGTSGVGAAGVGAVATDAAEAAPRPRRVIGPDYTAVHDPARPVPYDPDAT